MRRRAMIAFVLAAACTPKPTPMPNPPPPTSSTATPAVSTIDAPGDACTADGDVRLESTVIPGFPPATMRRRIEGTCATLVMSEGSRVGVFRARLDVAEVQALVDAVPSSIETKGMVPDMPVCSVDLRTSTRLVHLIVPLSPPSEQGAPLMNALNALDQKLLHRPLQTVRARLALPILKLKTPATARVTFSNDGPVPVDLNIRKLVVVSAPKLVITPGIAPLPVTLVESGSAGASSLHVEGGGEASVEVAVQIEASGTRVAAARIDLSFDIGASNASAPDGTQTIQARLQSQDVTFDVAP